MLTLSPKTIFDSLNLANISDSGTRNAITNLARMVMADRAIVAGVVNENVISYVAQDAQPTPEEGIFIIWKDTDAAAGQPKAYIVTTQDGVTYTFASKELV